MSLEGDVNQILNNRVDQTRLREMMDQPDPTYLFEEMTRESESITRASAAPLPEFNSSNTDQSRPIHSLIVSAPLRSEVSNGVAVLSLDEGIGGAPSGTGTGSTDNVAKVPFLVLTNGVVVTRNFHVDP